MLVPPEGFEGDIPFDEWPRTEPTELPMLVKFRGIVMADNTSYETTDEEAVTVLIDPLGAAGSHVVVLEDDNGRLLSVKFNSLTGTVDFFDGVKEFAADDG